MGGVRTPLGRYSSRHSHSWHLHRGFRTCFDDATTLPYHASSQKELASTASVLGLSPVTLSAQDHSTSELLRTL